MKNSFVLFADIYDVLGALTTEQKGLLFQLILDYQISGEFESTGDKVVDVAFIPIKQSLDRNNEKWEQIKQKRSEAGKKGMASRYKQDVTKTNKPQQKTTNVSRAFIPPSIEQVRAYCASRHNNVDAEAFVDFYSSKGWMIGKNKMKDWKSAVRTWERGDNRGAKVSKIEIDPKLRAFQASNEVVDWGM